MNPRTWMSWLAVSFVWLASCQGPHSYAARRATTKPGLVMAADETSVDAAQNPLAGAFYHDGSSGDVRARSENYLGRTTTLDDVTNALQSNASRGLDKAPTERAAASGSEASPVELQRTAPPERLLTYHGQIKVEVARPDDAIAQFLAQVKLWGGYMKSQQGAAVTVRLPAARLDEAFTLLRGTGRVLGETRQADDVTEEFVDLGIRLDNAQRARDRLLEVLKRADKVVDILKVEAELRRLTEEIERMEGRKKFLADQVAMATLQAVFTAVAGAPLANNSRRPSRFWWINEIGAEWVMENF